ncbi:ATP synthase F0 subunit B [bacterium]|nr:ATP synthase F0 subunit B [bacterium]
MDNLSLTAVVAQIINIGILFFLYKKFVANRVVKLIEEKKDLMHKLAFAEETYNQKLQEAQEEAQAIRDNAVAEKTKLLAEAGNL